MSNGTRTAVNAAQRAGVGAGRAIRVWRGLPHERRLAAGAALALFVTLFLPWYQETVIATSKAASLRSLTASVTGWGAFSFVEAAVLVVAISVLTLLFQRGEGRAFHLPGGDGWVIMLAGGWTCCLVVWRIFDKQGTSSSHQLATTWGIEWGIFVALAVAAFLAYTGSRIRAAHTPEPPLPGERGYRGGDPDELWASGPEADRGEERTRARRGGERTEASPGERSESRVRRTPGAAPSSSPPHGTAVVPGAAPAPAPAPETSRQRSGERSVGWLSGPPADAHERPAKPPGEPGDSPRTSETGSWSYREHVGEDDKVTGEWPVSDYDYSRSAPPTGSPDSRDTKDAAEPTIKRAAGDDPDETEANPSRRRRPHSPDDQLTIRLEREDRPN